MDKAEIRKVSAVLITLNEAENLRRTLHTLRWCDEILVVDSGSTDNTVLLSEAAGCRVLHHPFSGFGPQKRYAVARARHDWVLAIDADEVVTPDLAREIQTLLAEPTLIHSGYRIPRTLVFMDRVFRWGNEHANPQLRLFNRKHGNYSDSMVHETVEIRGSVGTLKGQMLHYSYVDIEQYFDKFNRYTSLAAHALLERGKRVSRFRIISRMPLGFFQVFVLQRNFLNGFPGFLWALFSSLYPVVKYAKLYELRSERSAPPPGDGGPDFQGDSSGSRARPADKF